MFSFLPLRRVNLVIVVKPDAQLSFHDERPGDGTGETSRVIAEGFSKFFKHLRGAGRSVDSFDFEFDLRRRNLHSIPSFERGLLLEIKPDQLLDRRKRKPLLKGLMVVETMLVIDSLDSGSIRAERAEIIRSRNWQNQQ